MKGISISDIHSTTKGAEDVVQNDGGDQVNSVATPYSTATTKVEANAGVEPSNVQNSNTIQPAIPQIESSTSIGNQPTANQQVMYSTPLHTSSSMQAIHEGQVHTGNKGLSMTNQQQNYMVPPQTLPLGKAANRLQQPKVLQQGMALQGQNQASKQISQPTTAAQSTTPFQSQSGQQVSASMPNSTSQSQIGIANQTPLNQQQSLQNKANVINNASQQGFIGTVVTPSSHPPPYQQLTSQSSSRMQQHNSQTQQSPTSVVHLQANNQTIQPQQQSQNPAALYPNQQGGLPAMPMQSLPLYQTTGQNASSVVHQGMPVAHNAGLLHNSQPLLQQPPGQLFSPNQNPSATLTAQQQAMLSNSGYRNGLQPQMSEPDQSDAFWKASMQHVMSISQHLVPLAMQLFNKLCSGCELSNEQFNFLIQFIRNQQLIASQSSLEAGAGDLRNINFNRLSQSLYDPSVLLGIPLRQSMPSLSVSFQDHVNDWNSRRYQAMQMQLLGQMSQQPPYDNISDMPKSVSDTLNAPYNRWEHNTNPVPSVNNGDSNPTAISFQATSPQFQPDQTVKQNNMQSVELVDNGLQNYSGSQPSQSSVHNHYNSIRNVQPTVQNTAVNVGDRLTLQSDQIANSNIASGSAISNVGVKGEQHQSASTNSLEVNSHSRTVSISDTGNVSNNESVVKLPEDNQQAPSLTVTEDARHSRFKIKKISEDAQDAINIVENHQSQGNEGQFDTVSISSVELTSPATQGSDMFFDGGLNDDAVIQSNSCPNITSFVDQQSPDGDNIIRNHAVSLSDSDCSELGRLNRLSKEGQCQAPSHTGSMSGGSVSGDTVRILNCF